MLQMKIKNKEHAEKGITLIALIVTIIVLLILAGVTITNITNGDGIIEQASGQRDKTKISAEEQILGNAVISASDKFGEITENNLRQSLSNQNVEITKSGPLYRIVFKDTNNLYKMNKDGEFFYWEDMKPTDIYAKKDGTILYLRSTQPDTSYVKGTRWNDNTITKVIIEEPIAPSTCEEMFSICSSLQEIENIENLHTENAVSMKKMFYNCTALKQLDVSNFDTSNVKNMNYMFGGQSVAKGKMSLERIIGLDSFDTSKVTDMSYMFSMCVKLKTLDVSSFDTGNVTNMACMFSGGWADKRFEMELEKIIGLENFKTGNVKYMQCMFNQCAYLTSLNLKSFDTSNVTNMRFMFCYCRSLTNLDISNFNTKKVTTMERMFGYCSLLKTLDISGFDTQLVNNMAHMFIYCNNLITIYVSNSFVTTNVSNSDKIFYCSTKIKGGQGTISGYNDNIKYAHIDGGSSNPGYFTEKASN